MECTIISQRQGRWRPIFLKFCLPPFGFVKQLYVFCVVSKNSFPQSLDLIRLLDLCNSPCPSAFSSRSLSLLVRCGFAVRRESSRHRMTVLMVCINHEMSAIWVYCITFCHDLCMTKTV